MAYYHSKAYDEAIADFSQAIQLNPNFDMAYENRAHAYFKKNDNRRGEEDMHRAESLKEQNAFQQILESKK